MNILYIKNIHPETHDLKRVVSTLSVPELNEHLVCLFFLSGRQDLSTIYMLNKTLKSSFP